MAQPAMAMAGSTASRASDFPNDHPAILIAVPSPVPRMKKPYGRFRTASITTAAVRIPPPVNNHPRRIWFHATPTILRQRHDRDGIADARRLDWPRRDRLQRRNNNNGETEYAERYLGPCPFAQSRSR